MSSSTGVTQSRRRLAARLAAAAGLAALCLTAAPATSASAAATASGMWLQNGRFTDAVLCASPDNNGTWMMSKAAAQGNFYCRWKQFGIDGQFSLYNLGKDEVMAFHGGNETPVVMEPEGSSGSGAHDELWSWGGQESGDGWDAAALQSYYDSGQNVDARSPYLDQRGLPRTDQVRTRGWRHGDQRELTWKKVAAL
ncbi:hypothetical protein AB0945_27975 [Streptomyces sp. NPDC005474]|uniref:hypothetical protein n=1 Tax=Streptomyces sp. NPDC005474 TaxID=3154878 RepID=UPI003455618B